MKASTVLIMQLLLAAAAWSQAASEYAGLRDRVKKGDLDVDFKQLRVSYISSPEYKKAKDTSEESKEMIQSINAKDFKKAIKNADVVLQNDYSDMNAHFAEYIAYRELGDGKQADFHHSVFDRLVNSILKSGDGRSKESAYVVVSVDEEYVVMRVLGLRLKNQSLVRDNGHSYDVLQTEGVKSGEKAELYFNVDLPMNRYMDLFGGKKE